MIFPTNCTPFSLFVSSFRLLLKTHQVAHLRVRQNLSSPTALMVSESLVVGDICHCLSSTVVLSLLQMWKKPPKKGSPTKKMNRKLVHISVASSLSCFAGHYSGSSSNRSCPKSQHDKDASSGIGHMVR